jgi:hypothetical protein
MTESSLVCTKDLINLTGNRRKAKRQNLPESCGGDPKQHRSAFDELFLANAAPTRIRWQE